MIGVVFAVCVFLLGAAIGSFLNVVIYRVPARRSIVRPASRCPACEAPIKPWHNIPVLGWLLIGGRCASCGVAISARYPLVELAFGLLAFAWFHDLSGGLLTAEIIASEGFFTDVVVPFVLYLVFIAGMVAIAFIDLDWFIIPDRISLPGIPLGVATAFAAGHVVGVSWQDSLVGAVAGAGVILLIILGYGLLTGREGMGGGDWKLLGVIGAYLGWQALPFVLFAASIQGILFAVVLGRAFAVEELPPEPGGEAATPESLEAEGPSAETSFSQLAVPFGPFLALAAVEFLLFAEEIRHLLERYLSFG
ncbi:MAG: prepilin peptidase [Myxococcota bacterium]